MSGNMSFRLLPTVLIACCVAFTHSFVPTRGRVSAFLPAPHPNHHVARLQSASVSIDTAVLPRIQNDDLKQLQSKGYVVIPNFLPSNLQSALRDDVKTLRDSQKFKVAKIGQDSTNALNTDIRVAETCFLGENKLLDVPSSDRSFLYQILDQVREDLSSASGTTMDPNLTELLYAYYPKGGFYRRHRDAIPGSASVLREVSLLLYLNEDWKTEDGGQLLLHFDSGGDELPEGQEPNYLEVAPRGGTLVLFQSDQIPHEVLDTNSERLAVVGWYNRPVAPSDVVNLGDGNALQPILLGLSAALITVGVVSLVT